MALVSELPDDRPPVAPQDESSPDANTRFSAFPEDATCNVLVLDGGSNQKAYSLGTKHVGALIPATGITVLAVLAEMLPTRNHVEPITKLVRLIERAEKKDVPYFALCTAETLPGDQFRKSALLMGKMDAIHIPSPTLVRILDLQGDASHLANRLLIVRDHQIVWSRPGGKHADEPFSDLNAFGDELVRQLKSR